MNSKLRVALVFMPFAIADRPSIQLGLLSEIARKAGFEAECFHLNLELAAKLPDIYNGLCAFRGHMTGEWLFSVAAFGSSNLQPDNNYFSDFPTELELAESAGVDQKRLSELRHKILPEFIDECFSTINWSDFDVVGFSSTFQQNTASLALAKKIKIAFPHIKTIVGGANMEGEMGPEYARSFPFLDYVVSGEADSSFPRLLEAISEEDNKISLIPGVTDQRNSKLFPAMQPVPFNDLDSSPVPDFDEYYARYNRLALNKNARYFHAIPVESSRGCWWGEKHHCTFCGLNGNTMKFRKKSVEKLLDELNQQTTKYGITMFQSTDNILDMGYIDSLFSKIEDNRHDYTFFYEVKSNLTRSQLGKLRRGGVRWIQPGIESLSNDVLGLMDKGCTGLQNIRLLKWSLYYKIRVGWNLLWGFPGETELNYATEYDLLSNIMHLEPPNSCGKIWMERFSPLFANREKFGTYDVLPEKSYSYVYPENVNLNKIAYFFDYKLNNTTKQEHHLETEKLVETWSEDWFAENRPTLVFRRTKDCLYVVDNRSEELSGSHRFTGPVADIYEICSDTMRSMQQIKNMVNKSAQSMAVELNDIEEILEEMCERRIMVNQGDRYLSLALPENENW